MVGAQLSAMVNSFTDRFCPELMAEMAVMYEGGWRPGFRAPKEGVRS